MPYEKDLGRKIRIIAELQTRTVIGVRAVHCLAGDWIHYAALAIKTTH